MSSEPQIPEELISKLCQCTSFEDAANLLKQLAELIIDQLRDFENLNSVVKSMVYWMES
jgi:hypothetical protein